MEDLQKIKMTGKIVFDPMPLNNNTKNMFKPWWVIVRMDCDIDTYYRWFFLKEKGLILQKPAWGPHISTVRGEECDIDLWNQMKEEYDGKEVEFEYEKVPKTNGKHIWMRVSCQELTDLRTNLGLEKHDVGLHMTIGMPIPRMREHLQYLHKIQW